MRRPLPHPRSAVRAAVAAVAATAAAALALGAPSAGAAGNPAPVELQLLSFNDYHGNLEPPSGSNGTLTASDGTAVTAGGVEYLATHLARLRQGHAHSLTVAAGDLVSGSPFLSSLFRDEPSVESLNGLGLDVSSVGNHEFDRGVGELLRLQYGGCGPDGCYDDDGYSGARFRYLAANVVYRKGVTPAPPATAKRYGRWFSGNRTGRTILPPTAVKTVGGIKVGFIGMTLEGTPELVAQAGIRDVFFRDEVLTAGLAAKDLRRRGVKAIVVLLHEGGLPPEGAGYDYDCQAGSAAGLSGPIVTIAQQLDPSIDLVVTGHTHQSYVCDIPDPSGRDRWVTSAASFGRLVTETTLQLDPRTGDVIRPSVRSVNHPVTRDVPADPAETATIAKWNALAAPVANRVVGSITGDVARSVTRDSESALADLIADAQLEATSPTGAGGAQVAFMNPGGVRADLTYPSSTAGEGDGRVTYGEAFTVQPFGNLLVSMTLSGKEIEQLLEQQWTVQDDGSVRFLALGVSRGFRYAYSRTAPVGDKVDPASITLDGDPVLPDARYRVTVNSFLADGGDGFTVLTGGDDRVGGGVDVDAFVAYLGAHSPVTGPTPDRVSVLP